MFTITITYLVDGNPETYTVKNVSEIHTNYNKTTYKVGDDEYVCYYVIKIKCKLQMEN